MLCRAGVPLLIASLAVVTVNASVENRNFFPLGEKEILTGNTGTGGHGSLGAVYYNPAALTMIMRPDVSVSASTYFQYHFEGDPMFYVGDTPIKQTSDASDSVPSSVIYAAGDGKTRYALSVLVPMAFGLESQSTWLLPEGTVYYQNKVEQTDIWLGASLARRLGEKWSIGASIYGSLHQELLMDNFIVQGHSPTTSEMHIERFEMSAYLLHAVLGMQRKGEVLSLGVRVHTPTAQLGGSGDFFIMDQSDSGADSENNVASYDDIEANYEVPADLGVGVVWHATERLDILVDASYQLGGSFDYFNESAIEGLGRSVEGTLRYNAGIEYRHSNKLSLLGGAYSVPSASTKDYTEDFVGVTGGVCLSGEQTKTTIGLFMLTMDGGGATSDDDDRVSRTSVTGIGAMFSTSYQF